QRAEEVVRRSIRLQYVELDMHVIVSLANGIGHGVQRLLVVADQMRPVIPGYRQRAQFLVHSHYRREPLRRIRTQCSEVQLIARLVDVRVDLILFASPRTRQARVSDDEEEDHAHVRNEEDGEKPGHRSRWASIAWNDDDRDD